MSPDQPDPREAATAVLDRHLRSMAPEEDVDPAQLEAILRSGAPLLPVGEVRELVKKEKCEPSKKLAYKFIGEAFGKEMKPTGMNITCPRK